MSDSGDSPVAAALASVDARHGKTVVQADVIAALRRPAAFGAGCAATEVIETHISYVFLTGRYAYKVKKAVRLPFLDFSDLSARRRYCELELALNRRTAPSIYLDVVPVVATGRGFEIGGDGEAVEWAVRMRQFPQEALLSRLIERGTLTARDVDRLAERVAGFHESVAERAPPDTPYGTPREALRLALENLDQLEAMVRDDHAAAIVEALRAWTMREHAARRPLMAARTRNGSVRACHGDLHLDNVALVDGEPLPFDCIEFDPCLRWSDVVGDIAYTAMDLRARGRADLARRFVNRYLEVTGDYAGVPLLRFHLVYRAVVRAKVAYLRAGQDTGADACNHRQRGASLLDLARTLAEAGSRTLVAMHGVSGCGKSWLSQALAEQADVVRIRMDVERKRLKGLAATARSGSGVGDGLYAPDVSHAAYEHVAALAESALAAGQPVVVDAAFLKRWQRDVFRGVAKRCDATFVLLDVVAPEDVLRARVTLRRAAGADASEADIAVLEHQLATQDRIQDDERPSVVTFDAAVSEAIVPDRWRALVAPLLPPSKLATPRG